MFFLDFFFDVAFIAFCHHKLFSVEIDGVIKFRACWVEQVELAYLNSLNQCLCACLCAC